MRKLVRLTEGDLHRIVENSVRQVLREGWVEDDDIPNVFTDNKGRKRYIAPNDPDGYGVDGAQDARLDMETDDAWDEYDLDNAMDGFTDDPDSKNFMGKPLLRHKYPNNAQFRKPEDRMKARDRRWQKAADSRPLHRKGSLNRA